MELKKLKPGSFFTLKEISEPKDSQVYIKGEYDRALKKFFCCNFDDINRIRHLQGNKIVYTEFTF